MIIQVGHLPPGANRRSDSQRLLIGDRMMTRAGTHSPQKFIEFSSLAVRKSISDDEQSLKEPGFTRSPESKLALKLREHLLTGDSLRCFGWRCSFDV